jgi:S-layer homology domain
MKDRRIDERRMLRTGSALLALLLPSLSAAQQEPLDRATREPVTLPAGAVVYPQGTDPDQFLSPKSGYGTDDVQVVNVPFSGFFPRFSSATYTTLCCISEGARWPTADDNLLLATIDAGLVPNGADLEQVAFYIQDNSAADGENFRGFICRSWVDANGANPDQDCPVEAVTESNPGNTVITFDPNFPVRYRYDIDGDGTDEVVSYTLWAQFGTNPHEVYDGSIRLRQARLLFRRQISPAPAAATFSDVPTSHPFFQFVEALADSGITAGCGTGIYCPDAPLTRGQMAVFLAKALGLHWPAF